MKILKHTSNIKNTRKHEKKLAQRECTKQSRNLTFNVQLLFVMTNENSIMAPKCKKDPIKSMPQSLKETLINHKHVTLT